MPIVDTGHRGEISSCQFDFEGTRCITGSIDRSCKLWDVRTGSCLSTLRGHNDEILDGESSGTHPISLVPHERGSTGRLE